MIIQVLVLAAFSVSAQTQENECLNSLYQANKYYTDGHFQEAMDLVAPCINEGNYSGKELFAALRLLSICHLENSNQQEAHRYAVLLLKAHPEYIKYPLSDPVEFTKLLSEYDVQPLFEVGVQFGLNQYRVQVMEAFSPTETTAEFTGKGGFGAGVVFRYSLNDRMQLGVDPWFGTMRYQVDLDNVAGSERNYSEILSAIEVPISFTYRRPFFGQMIFANCGVQALNITSSYASVESTNTSVESPSVVQSSTNQTDFRNRLIPGAHFGLGIEFPLGKGIFSVSAIGRSYFTNIVDSDKRYENAQFITRSGYLDSDIKLQSIGLVTSLRLPIKHSVTRK